LWSAVALAAVCALTGTAAQARQATEAAAADGTLRHVLLTEDTGPVLLDRRTGARRSAGPAGATALPDAVTRNGRAVVLASTAEDLVPGDTNGVADVFVVRPR
jgi:hypothetical protein